MKELYTLITGGSSGIGKALAEECAARDHNLLLVALPGTHLKDIAERLISEYGIDCDYFHRDLTDRDAPGDLYNWIKENNYRVNILINNAGISFEGPFEDCPPEFYEKSMLLNMVALVSLTRLFIEDLKMMEESYILNVGSVASYFPLPYKSVYSASKAFVFSFSRSLRMEFKKTPVTISVLTPGPVVTNRRTALSAIEKGKIAQMMHTKLNHLARYAVSGLLRKRAVIRPGFLSQSIFWLEKILPTPIKMKLAALIFK
jgi:short-subunit dehydrogenase